jgi:hypothetical protein
MAAEPEAISLARISLPTSWDWLSALATACLSTCRCHTELLLSTKAVPGAVENRRRSHSRPGRRKPVLGNVNADDVLHGN